MKDLPKHKDNLLSDELFDKIEIKKKENLGWKSTQWIYLSDCVSRGTISLMEAYDCLALGYVAEHLQYRKSNYTRN